MSSTERFFVSARKDLYVDAFRGTFTIRGLGFPDESSAIYLSSSLSCTSVGRLKMILEGKILLSEFECLSNSERSQK